MVRCVRPYIALLFTSMILQKREEPHYLVFVKIPKRWPEIRRPSPRNPGPPHVGSHPSGTYLPLSNPVRPIRHAVASISHKVTKSPTQPHQRGAQARLSAGVRIGMDLGYNRHSALTTSRRNPSRSFYCRGGLLIMLPVRQRVSRLLSCQCMVIFL
jgi:hypothetical protein